MRHVVRSLIVLGLPLAVGLGLWLRWPRVTVDAAAVPPIATPVWSADGPTVLIDDGHLNPLTGRTGLAPLAALLRADGYRVLEDDNAGRAEVLRRTRVAIVAAALGPSGALRTVLTGTGLERLPLLDGDAMLGSEVETIEAWVRNGGSLLIAADPAPAGPAMAALAARFGVGLAGGTVIDRPRSVGTTPWRIAFTRDAGLAAGHPILDGTGPSDRITRVVTDAAPALTTSDAVTVLLRLGPSALEVPTRDASADTGTPVSGRAHAVALTRGRGRVVVLADAGLLTAERRSDGTRGGLAETDSDNARFVRRLVHWLAAGQ